MKQLLFLCVFFLSSVLMAQQVSNDILSKAARNAYVKYVYNGKIIRTGVDEISSKYSISSIYGQQCHLFNFEQGGYVILAGDYRFVPVLGFSDKGEIRPTELLPAVDWWIKQYLEEMDFSIKNNSRYSNHNQAWVDLLNPVKAGGMNRAGEGLAPMLRTSWGQSPYYNDSCPIDPKGKCVTGCVATALGQLMAYYRHPEQGTGSYSYVDEHYGLQSVDFSAQTYNYDLMPYRLDGPNSEVAKLLYHAGVSVDMHYGPTGSGMTNHKAAYMLKTYFGYSNDCRYYFRDSSDVDWIAMIIGELNQKRPLYYAGWSDTLFQSGHAFILDGYRDSSYYHIDWGWNGSQNGYFYIENLTPGGSNFKKLHEVLINSVPVGEYPHIASGERLITSLSGIIDDGSGPLYNYQVSNTCKWLIDPNDSVSIKLTFTDFDLAEGDFLTIYDGETEQDEIIATLSGSVLPDDIVGTRSKMLIVFNPTASVNSGAGFQFQYKCVLPEYCASNTLVDEYSGEIFDGSNEFMYHNNTSCGWKFAHNDMSWIEFTFTEFDIDSTDYVRIYDAQASKVIADYTGKDLPPVTKVYSNAVSVRLKSDGDKRAQGFRLKYNIGTVGVDENDFSNAVQLYPNPASEGVNIVFSASTKLQNYRLLTPDGQVKASVVVNGEFGGNISFNGLPEGLYFVELNTNKGKIVKKVLIQF